MSRQYPKNDQEIKDIPWKEVTEAEYDEMLCVLPPDKMGGGAFAVGEPLCHTDDGKIVEAMYVSFNDKFYTKPERLNKFNPEQFKKEIREQFTLTN